MRPKASLLKKENFEVTDRLIDKILIIKQLETNSKNYPFTTDASTVTNTITTPAQTYKQKNKKNNKIRNTKKKQ